MTYLTTKTKPLVSIGVPTYNRYDQLKTCLEHILAQDYDCIDVLIADNSSDIPTPAWLTKLIHQDQRVQYVKHCQNIGMVDNENFVRSNRCGEFVAIIHDDDIVPYDYISSLIKPLLNDRSIALSGPLCKRYLDGDYWYTYQSYCSVGKNQYSRLIEVATLAFENPWGFEHLIYGIYRNKALPATFRFGQWRSIILFFFLISIHGSIHTETNCELEKHNISSDLQKYQKASYVKRLKVVSYIMSRRQEERLTILARLMLNTLRSDHIHFYSKLIILAKVFSVYLGNKAEFSLAH